MDEQFFRARFEADAANRARQSWADHWAWVETFYEGKRFPPVPGWRTREEALAARHADAATRAQLSEVGRLLASEWAKDNAVRKVSTSDLQAWGKRFEGAASSAESLRAALAGVRDELAQRGVT